MHQTQKVGTVQSLVFSITLLMGLFLFTGQLFAATTATLYPSADGAYAGWTPKSGSVHYTQVDETTCNGTTDYVSTATVGKRDSYSVGLSSIPDGSTITNIQITPCASRNSNGGGSSVMNVFYTFDAANSADAGGYALTGTTPTNLSATNFGSLSHVKGSASTLEIGAVYTSGTKGARLGRLATVVTYTLPTPPTPPTNVVTTNISGTENSVSWTDASANEAGFKIERSTNEGAYVQIGTTSADVSTYTDTTVAADTLYSYRVRAYNVTGNSAYATSGYVITATVVPAAPVDLSYFVSTSTPVDVWLYVTHSGTNEEGFVFERSTDNVNFSTIGTEVYTTSSYQYFTDIPPSSGTFYYRVYAYNAVGDSTYSNTIVVEIP